VNLFVYILVYPFITLVSYLPFRVLYVFSDFLYIILYRIFGYRKKVVRNNLLLAFPDKTNEERLRIEKDFYKHLSDLFVEMIKAFQMPVSQMQRRYTINNVDMLNGLTAKRQNISIVGGHYANWEWIFSLGLKTNAFPVATYLKINNPYFEKMMLKNRQRFRGRLIETKDLRKSLKRYVASNEGFILGLLADQSPQVHRSKYWRPFFGHTVPVFVGPEELTKQYEMAYVFMDISKIKRGYYQVDFELITDQPNTFPDYELTDIFIDKLEKQIRKAPQYYLWTHKRFKHKGKLKEVSKRRQIKIS